MANPNPNMEGLKRWFEAHPGVRHGQAGPWPEFPEGGTVGEQAGWFRDRFLEMARKSRLLKEKAEFLRLAFTAALKGAEKGSNTDDLYREHLARMVREREGRDGEDSQA